MTTTTEPTRVAVPDPALERLLTEGRRQLAARRAFAAREAATKAEAERRAFEASITPMNAAVLRLLPACWHHYVDPREGEFVASYGSHTVHVNLPGLAPIAVGLSVESWDDARAHVGRWQLGSAPFRIAGFHGVFDEEQDAFVVIPDAVIDNWTRTADPAEATALAQEAAAKREQLAAECVERTEKRSATIAARQMAEKLRPRPTPAERLAEALRLASLNWLVEKTQLYYFGPDGMKREAAGAFGLVRQDTGEMLGTVGKLYKPIQNADGFQFLDEVLGDFGARYHTAGSVFGGRRVWCQVELPRQSFEVVAGDKVDAFALFTNPHDGSGSAYCYPTSHRAVCANTLRVANRDKGKGISVPHFGDMKGRIKSAQQALGLAVEGFEEFREGAEVLARTACPNPRAYFGEVLDAVLEVTAAQVSQGADVLASAIANTEAREKAVKAYQRAIDDRGSILTDIIERHESDRCRANGIAGTAWAALNAVTEHADHAKRRELGTDDERRSRRFESILTGERDELKQVAYSAALALAN